MLDDWTQEVADILHLYMVLDTAQRKPFTVKSGFARNQAQWIAFCASEGFLSTRVEQHTWGDKWHVTASGRKLLGELEDDLAEYTKH
jgi:hypothetical protein